MQHRIETMKQPNGSIVTIYIEQIDGYTDDEIEKIGKKHRLYASIHVDYGYGNFCNNRNFDRILYSDKLGLYTYTNQKTPFYYWKPQNIEEDYEHWSKNNDGYSLPINEPRKLKKDYFY